MSDDLDVVLDRRAFHQEADDYVKQIYAELSARPDTRADLISRIGNCKRQIAELKCDLANVRDEAELHHVKRKMQPFELAMANLEEKLRACPEPEQLPESIVVEPPGEIAGAAIVQAQRAADPTSLNAGLIESRSDGGPVTPAVTIAEELPSWERYVCLLKAVTKKIGWRTFLAEHPNLARTSVTDYQRGELGGRVSPDKQADIEAAILESARTHSPNSD